MITPISKHPTPSSCFLGALASSPLLPPGGTLGPASMSIHRAGGILHNLPMTQWEVLCLGPGSTRLTLPPSTTDSLQGFRCCNSPAMSGGCYPEGIVRSIWVRATQTHGRSPKLLRYLVQILSPGCFCQGVPDGSGLLWSSRPVWALLTTPRETGNHTECLPEGAERKVWNVGQLQLL